MGAREIFQKNSRKQYTIQAVHLPHEKKFLQPTVTEKKFMHWKFFAPSPGISNGPPLEYVQWNPVNTDIKG